MRLRKGYSPRLSASSNAEGLIVKHCVRASVAVPWRQLRGEVVPATGVRCSVFVANSQAMPVQHTGNSPELLTLPSIEPKPRK